MKLLTELFVPTFLKKDIDNVTFPANNTMH